MNDGKLISVVMASNRVDEYLCLAVNSMLKQSYKYIELIFVANGNNAKSVSEFLSKNIQDPRLKVIETPIGQLSFSLNLGISHACGDYIARMDADDISLPNRLEKQLEYMELHNLDMVATDLKLINASGETIGTRIYPKGIDKINKQLPYRNTYLWLRLKRYGVKWDNMSECLLEYRIHDESTQRRRLGYAESAGYSLREFILKFSFYNFFAVIFHVIKSYSRAKK